MSFSDWLWYITVAVRAGGSRLKPVAPPTTLFEDAQSNRQHPFVRNFSPSTMTRSAKKTAGAKGFVFFTLAAVILGLSGYFIADQSGDPYRTVAVLDVRLFLENSNSLRGNNYKIEGTILNCLGWSTTRGRMFSIEVRDSMEIHVLPVVVPAELNKINIQRGQKFLFHVTVDDQGFLRISELRKK